ncbi:MAG: PAS domain-containing protein [Chloroflexota bacterium]
MSDKATELFGDLDSELLLSIMDALPIDISFVDANDKVTYFNTPRNGRIFARTKMDIGRSVERCHPPQSVHRVRQIIDGFKDGTRDRADFWLPIGDRLVLIRYFPVRSASGEYLGTLEVTQDIAKLKKIEGQRRLLDEAEDVDLD